MRIYANDGVPLHVAPRSFVLLSNSPVTIMSVKQKLSYIMVVDDLYLLHIDGPVAILMFVVPFVSGIVE